MARIVLDCSAAIAGLLPDERDASAGRLLDHVVENGAVVPMLWALEMANALLVVQRRGRISATDRLSAVNQIGNLPISVDGETVALTWSRVFPLAEDHGLTIYDAAYLELAIRLGLPLATRDGKLAEAGRRAGVAIFAP